MKNNFVLLTICSLGFFGFVNHSIVYPVMPLYAVEVGASISQVGLVVSFFAYTQALLMIPAGLLSDKLSQRNLLVAGLLIATVSPLLYIIASNPVQLSLVRAFHGLGMVFFIPTALTIIVETTPKAAMGKAFGAYTTATHFGSMVGPVIGGYLLNQFSYEASFLSCSVFSIIGLVLLFMRFKDIPGKKPAEHVVKPLLSETLKWLSKKPVMASMLAPLFIAAAVGTFSAYIPLYSAGFGINEVGAGIIFTAFYASSTLSRIPAGMLSDKFGRGPLIIFGMVLSVIAVASISGFNSLFYLCITAICFGIGTSVAQPASLALAADYSRKGEHGLAMGIFAAIFQIGLAVGPTVLGLVAGKTGFVTMFLACAAVVAFGLIVIFILLRSKNSEVVA